MRLPTQIKNQLSDLLLHSALREGHVGIAVEALGTVSDAGAFPARAYDGGAHPLLFASGADQRYLPASNLKLFTAALALQQLGPEHTFATRVLRVVRRTASANMNPLLILQGGGDPSLATEDLTDLAKQAATANGENEILEVRAEGDAFHADQFGGRYPFGWTLDDSIWYYGPPVSALAINRNQFDINVTGGAQPGDPVSFNVSPINPQKIILHATTGAIGSPDTLTFDFARVPVGEETDLIIGGTIAPKQTHADGIAVLEPEAWAGSLFHSALLAAGAKDAPEERSKAMPFLSSSHSFTDDPSVITEYLATHQSPPLSVLLQKFLKTSDNLYGEMLLRDAALYGKDNAPDGTPKDPKAGTADYGHKLLRAWLKSQGINDAPLRFEDGSGLSRYDLVTPHSLVDLLRAVQTLKGGESFYAALPVAGADGTLKKRMVGTHAQNNARAKTGTFSIASCLSGYVTTQDGHRLAVSVMTNFVQDGEAVRRVQDRVFAVLAAARLKEEKPGRR